nr:proline-rich receptor-like protein kinase PERK1 [Rhipicephalus microplus]
MYRCLWSTAGSVCLAIFLDAARAESTDWEDQMRRQFQPSYDDSRWKRHRSRELLSTGAIVGIVVAIVAAAVSVFLCCCYRRRRRRTLATQHIVVPPAMAPAMSGVAPYTYAGSYPPVPVAMTSAVSPHPQPNYYEQQAAQHAQRRPLQAGHHMASPSGQPSTMPMPPPTAPPEPPPPYNYRANYPR